MKLLVGVKRVIDYSVKVRVRGDGMDVVKDNVKMSINPFDEIALEEAVRLKEKGVAKEIIAISIGPEASQETLRHALALGADRAELIKTEDSLEPINIAKIFEFLVKKHTPDLVLLGKQAIDDDSNQVGQMLAGLLHWPQATFASKLEVNEKDAKLSVVREVDAGLETVEVMLPAVVTSDLRLNEPRYTSLPNIMKAKQKPLELIALESLNLELKSHSTLISVSSPKQRQAGVRLETIDAFFEKLDAGDWAE